MALLFQLIEEKSSEVALPYAGSHEWNEGLIFEEELEPTAKNMNQCHFTDWAYAQYPTQSAT